MYECYFCYFVSYSKCREIFNRSSNSIQEYLEPIKLWKIALKNVCLYFHRLREMRACSTETLRSYRIQKSAHLVYFTWSLQYSISDWFSDTSLTSAKHSPFVDFLIEAAAVHGLLILIWLSRSIYFATCTQVWRIWSYDQTRSVYGGWLTKVHLGKFSERKKA